MNSKRKPQRQSDKVPGASKDVPPTQTELTLYKVADTEIRKAITAYLKLVKATNGLANVSLADLKDERARTILLAGLAVRGVMSAGEALEEWRRRQAIPFDLETAIAAGVYKHIRSTGVRFLDILKTQTGSFTEFSPSFIKRNPYLLPLFQHLAGIFSKAALKEVVGSVSDNAISGPAAERLSKLLQERVDPRMVNKGEVLKRLKSTLEGIVRDLIGRVLFESIVDRALTDQGLLFQREEEYESLNSPWQKLLNAG